MRLNRDCGIEEAASNHLSQKLCIEVPVDDALLGWQLKVDF
jgi:hypothetical protein